MADQFDPYREANVQEEVTIWGPEFDDLEPAEKNRLAAALHAKPAEASNLEYVRIHTGFCRQIVVTADDVARVNA